MTPLFDSVLVANRGEIACRIIGTLQRLGIRAIAVYSEADAAARHVRAADAALCIGPAPATESYLNIPALVAACRASGATAVHPGYGFLSENVAFARALAEAGVTFIGPAPQALQIMGDKIRAKNHVQAAGVPVVPGIFAPGLSDTALLDAAAGVGYPLLIKPSAGGGGKGMVAVTEAAELPAALAAARRIAASAFGDDTLFLERLVASPRHIEVQILGDGHGGAVHLGERECSLQRRHQKVIEEAPAPLLHGDADTRARIGAAACAAAASVNYAGAGTVEFLVSAAAPTDFFFMEMNTRLQVEHPVTEMVARVRDAAVDLVEWQLRIAAGEPLTFTQAEVSHVGHAIEARVYAEYPERGFLPASGTVALLEEAGSGSPGVRVDSSLLPGLLISEHYDPLLSKVIAWGADREHALDRLDTALRETVILGVGTNIEYLRLLLADPEVRAGRLDTTLLERTLPGLRFRPVMVRDYAAAALWLRHGAAGAVPDTAGPWARRDGWRGGAASPWRLCFAGPGRDETVVVSGTQDDGVVQVADTPGQASSLLCTGAAAFTLLWDGQPWPYRIVQQDGAVLLATPGWSARLPLLDRDAAMARQLAGIERPAAAADPEVRTPMPGTVTAVHVRNGDHVVAGTPLLSVEAMKMENQLTAALTGTVQLRVTVGQLVKAEQLLATLTPPPPQESPHGEL